MFSQFRQAVENFAPPPPSRTGSQDVARSASPRSSSGHVSNSNSLPDVKVPKSNLEERLRAKLAAADSFRSSTPVAVPVTQHPLSPTSTPLPVSPAISPVLTSTFDIDTPLNLDSVASSSMAPSQPLSAPTEEEIISNSSPQHPTKAFEEDGADISDALSLSVHPATKTQAHPEPLSKSIDESAPQEEPTLPEIDIDDMDLESLQTRLKLVEQRFTGMLLCPCGPNSADTSVLDVSTSFKRLQAERLAADSVLRELSPLETMQDIDGLRDYLQNLGLKTEVHIIAFPL